MPMPRYIQKTRYCNYCKKELVYTIGLGKKRWESKNFCNQSCNGKWQSFHKSGIHNPETFYRRWENRNREEAKKLMLGNKLAIGHKLSEKHKLKLVKHGSDHWAWKEELASYGAFHKWLVKNFGSASRCESINCPKLPTRRYEYALLDGKEHSHKRENYRMLCIPCHRSYDSRRNKLNAQF